MVSALLAAASLAPASSTSAQEVPGDAPAPAIPPIPWQLTQFPGVDAGIEPGRYTVHFLPDETVNIRADCNWVAGFWTGANGALDVTVTMTTVAECPPGSLEEPFVQGLDEATTYTFAEGMTLIITGPNGEMRFTPAMPAMAWEMSPAAATVPSQFGSSGIESP
jgi:heat shock protein HslJ